MLRFISHCHRNSLILKWVNILQVNSFVGAFHDAVILYALALNETLQAGHNVTNGTEITRRMWNRSFEGKSPGAQNPHQNNKNLPLLHPTSRTSGQHRVLTSYSTYPAQPDIEHQDC